MEQGSGVKIQINSLAALERLLGDEMTMEFEVRKSVIEAFARQFVKNINNLDELKKMAKAISESTQEEIAEQATKALEAEGITVKNVGWKRYQTTLNDKARLAIDNEVHNLIISQIQTAVNEMDIESLAQSLVERRLDNIMREHIKKIALAKFEEAIS